MKPPPTKYGSANFVQAKPIPTGARVHAPPPTKFGAGGAAQAKGTTLVRPCGCNVSLTHHKPLTIPPQNTLPTPVMQMYRFGASNTEITNNQYFNGARGTTFGTLINDNGNTGTYKNNKSKTFGAEHAEDVIIRSIYDGIDRGDYSSVHLNQIIMTTTASPCTSISRSGYPATTNKIGNGCTEEIIDIIQNGITASGSNYSFQLHLFCHHLYQPKGKGKGVKAASAAALEAIKNAGAASVVCQDEYGDFDDL